jgi:hypothetical protein
MKKTTTTDVQRTIFREFHMDEGDIKQALIEYAELDHDTTIEFDVSVDGRLQGAILRHTRTEKDQPQIDRAS